MADVSSTDCREVILVLFLQIRAGHGNREQTSLKKQLCQQNFAALLRDLRNFTCLIVSFTLAVSFALPGTTLSFSLRLSKNESFKDFSNTPSGTEQNNFSNILKCDLRCQNQSLAQNIEPHILTQHFVCAQHVKYRLTFDVSTT